MTVEVGQKSILVQYQMRMNALQSVTTKREVEHLQMGSQLMSSQLHGASVNMDRRGRTAAPSGEIL